MLVSWEKHSYNIAVSAATGMSFDADNDICQVCNGTGLLPHPSSYMNVAVCYMCRSGLVPKGQQQQKKKRVHLEFDPSECCNVSAKTVSA